MGWSVWRLDVRRPHFVQMPFPTGHGDRGNGIADHIGRAPAHIKEVIDRQDHEQAGLGDIE